jgi:hypothetical protein
MQSKPFLLKYFIKHFLKLFYWIISGNSKIINPTGRITSERVAGLERILQIVIVLGKQRIPDMLAKLFINVDICLYKYLIFLLSYADMEHHIYQRHI